MDWVIITVGAIFLICIIVGICQGAIRIAVSLATTLLTLVIVFFATPHVAKAIAQYTPVDEMIEQKVSAAILDAAKTHLTESVEDITGGKMSEDDVRAALNAAGVSEEDLESQGITVSDIAEGNIDESLLSQLGIDGKIPAADYGDGKEGGEEDGGSLPDNMEIPRDLQQEAINAADLPDVFKNLLTVNNNDEIYEELGVESFAQYVGSFLAKLIINVISYLGTFLIVTIILRAIVFALDIVAELPVLGLINRLAGGAVGFVGAAIIVWILFIAVTLLYTTVIGKDIYQTIQGNGILKFLYDHNPIMGMAMKI
ncbi:MAG: CvpA family protein [Dorea sp.]|nr:CvpA family protein [Dorea sp.]